MITLNREMEILHEMEQITAKLRSQIMETLHNEDLEDYDEDYKKLKLQNTKLKCRLSILEAAVANEKKLIDNFNDVSATKSKKLKTQSEKIMAIIPKEVDEMISISEHLNDLITNAIAVSYPQLDDITAIIAPIGTKESKFGDYQCNNAMPISKILKTLGINKSPRDIANEIVKNIEKSPLVSKVEIAGPGYINIFLEKSYAVRVLSNILIKGVKPPKCEKKRVLIDFSSPNIAKEMHVGHLRSTIIGETICRFLEFMGHDVLRVNHLGDWGTQFGMLIAHLEDSFPNFLNESPPISDLQAFYKESKKRFDEDEDFKKRAYNRVVTLQNGDPNSIKAWNLICDVSRMEFQKIYDRLEVTINEKGESFYQSRMLEIVKFLNENNFLEMDEGRKIMWPDDTKSGIPMTIIKSDGGFTYDTSDMAAIRYRIEEEKANWLIYVVDAGQNTHLKSIFLGAERCGILKPNLHRADHVQFGVVLGEDGKKFKTRSGESIKLSDLLDEGIKRAMEELKRRGRDKELTLAEQKAAVESLAYGCIKYADLCHNRTHDYVFSFDKMLEDRGNTAVYLLYNYTRICSISRNCGDDFSNLEKILEKYSIELEHEKEWKLAKTMLKFPDILLKMSKDLLPHVLCEFCYDLSCVFSEFYDNCYCIEKDKNGKIVKINHGRILLCEITAALLRQCFNILGLNPVRKM